MTLINRSTVCAQCRGSHAPLLSYETVARGVTGTVLLHPECRIVWTSARWVEAAKRAEGKPSRTRGTVEHHSSLDVRHLTSGGLFYLPVPASLPWVGLRCPWLRLIRTNSSGIEITWRAGHTEQVQIVWVRAGAIGLRPRFECPRCHRRVCKLYDLGGTHACRTCGGLWYACQRRSANGRRCLRVQRLRLKLGGGKSLKSLEVFPPRPRRMWRRTYERYRRREMWFGRRLNRFQWRDPDYRVLVPR
jgi:hypothetical protein